MSWLLKWAGWQAYAVFAAIVLALAAAWYVQVAGLKVDVATANSAKSTAEKNLSDRIAAEATAISDAVTKARGEEQQKLKDQEKKYATLLETNRTARVALAATEQRLYRLAAEAAGRQGLGGRTNSTTTAGGAAEASANELRPADRNRSPRKRICSSGGYRETDGYGRARRPH